MDRARSDIRLLGSCFHQRRGTGLYMGWVGFGNLGDEALFDAFRAQVEPSLDLHGSQFSRSTVGGLRLLASRKPNVTDVVLGGGTLIGREPWGRRYAALCAQFPDSNRWTVGVGVEDPNEPGTGSPSSWRRDLDQFMAVLPEFAAFSTRGPRSAAVLEHLGLRAPWVGDPALLLGPDALIPDFRERSLLVSVGEVDRVVGSSSLTIVAEVARATRRLLAEGWRVTVVQVSRRDKAAVTSLVDGLRAHRAVTVAPPTTDWRSFQTLAADHHVGIHVRLHPGVLSAATFAPFIQVAYLPKNNDFIESIGQDRHGLSAASVTAPEIVEAVLQLAEEREGVQQELLTAVTDLRSRLHREFALGRGLR